MKALKLISTFLAMILIVLPIAAAVDVPPVLTLNADVDRTTTTAVITAVATDVLDNAGLAWIKLYEDGNLIETKDCNPQHSSCVLVKAVVKTSEAKLYTYRAEALDKGGNIVSQEIQVVFAGVDEIPPQYSNILAAPASPAPYGSHRFSADWTDNSRISKVEIEHNFFGTTFKAEVTGNTGDTYYYDMSFIELGDFQWRMIAEDVAEQGPNTNSTPWQTYQVVKADPTVNWSAAPDWTVDIGTATTVGCILADSRNTESQAELFREGTPVPNPDIVTLSAVGTYVYTCNGTETAHYHAFSDTMNMTVNRIISDATLFLNSADADLAGVERLTGTVDINGVVNTGDNDLEIYIDGQLFASGASPLSNSTTFNISGDYNVTLIAPETPNYARFEAMHWVTVQDTVVPNPVAGLTAANIGEEFINITWTNPADDDFAGVMVYLDGALVDDVNDTNVTDYLVSGLNFSTQYNITLNTYDNDANIGADATLIVSTLADTTPPTVTFVSGDTNYTYAADAWTLLEVDVAETFTIDSVWFENNFTGVLLDTPADGNVSDRYFLNATGLPAGDYQWRGFANDTFDNTGFSGYVNFSVYKAVSDINLTLDNAKQNVTISENGVVDINVTLEAGEADITVLEDGAPIYAGPAPYSAQRAYPTVGSYNITAVYPESQNYTADSETLFVNVTDIMPPGTITALVPSVVAADWIYWTWANPVDPDFNESIIYLNGANVANTSNNFYNATGLVPESTNEILIHTKDHTGNVNDTDVNDTVILPDITDPVITVLAQPSDRLYDAAAVDQFLVNVTDNRVVDTVQFELDGVNQTVAANAQGLYEVNITGASAAQYFFRWHANDTEGNLVNTSLENYTVSKPASGVDLTLNGAKQNIVSVGPITGVNISASKLAGEGPIDVLENGVSLYSGEGPFTTLRDYTVIANYNITVDYPETQNFSASSETYWVYVQPVIRNVSLSYPGSQVIPTDANATYTITVNNTGNTIDNFTLSITSTNSTVTDLAPFAVTGLAPGASTTATLTVGDPSLGNYLATVHAVSDNDGTATFDLDVTTIVAPYSTVIDSTILGVYYSNTQTTSIPQLYVSHVEGSTVTHVDTDINNSQVYRSTIDNSYILASSQINDSTVTNSILSNCIVINSVLDSIIASNCYVKDSYGDPSDLTGSTITGGSNIINSTFTNSNGDNAQVTDSFVDNSNVTASTITNGANVNSADIVNGATIDNSAVTGATVDSSTLINGAVVTGGSTVTNSNIDNANIDNSTIVNSDVPDGTTVADAVIQDGVIMNGTVDGNPYTTPTNLTDAINYPPVAGISASSTSITVGGSVTFTSTSTDVNIGGVLNDSIASYDWSIGGASFGTNSTASRTFSSTGTYVVVLGVTDSFGASDTSQVTITVNPASSSGSSGGSRRSSRSTGPRIISLLDLQPEGFVTVDLFETDIVKFMFKGAEETVTIKDIQPTHIDVYIQAVSDTFTIEKFFTEHINLDGDMLNDISIMYNGMPASRTARVTFGLKAAPSYDPIYTPEEAEPEPVDEEPEEEEDTGVTGGAVVDVEDEDLSMWQRFIEWLKRLFGVRVQQEDGVADEPAEDAEPVEEEEEAEEQEAEAAEEPAEEAEAEPVEDEPEEQEEAEAEEDESDEESAEDEDEEEQSFWQRFVSWFRSGPEREEPVEAEAEEEEEVTEAAVAGNHAPRAWLGWLFAFLIIALSVASYFVVRKEINTKRIQKYL